jgi:hypothetical protein
MEWHYTRKLAAVAWMWILDFFSRYMDWVPANIMTEFFHCFWRCDRNSGCRCFYHSLPEFLGGWPSTLNDRGCWHWVMAACHHYSWWRWWPDTLCVTLIRLWPKFVVVEFPTMSSRRIVSMFFHRSARLPIQTLTILSARAHLLVSIWPQCPRWVVYLDPHSWWGWSNFRV